MEETLLLKNGIVKKDSIKVFENKIVLGQIVKKHKIIASLTSFPFRIQTLHIVMERIFNQTLLADEVHLYLAKEQFPNLEKDLTSELLSFCDRGLDIIWVDEDIRPHKKYYYVMLSNPNDIIITLDDDLLYELDVFEKLYCSYLENPYCISTMRARLITFNGKNQLNCYEEWENEYSKIIGIPSMLLVAIGVGGVLYPPKCLHSELFNHKDIKGLCLNTDDLWLKTMQVMNNIPTVLVQPATKLNYVEGSQEERLYDQNITENDNQLKAILYKYNEYFGKEDTLINRLIKSKLNEVYRTKDDVRLNEIGVRRKLI